MLLRRRGDGCGAQSRSSCLIAAFSVVSHKVLETRAVVKYSSGEPLPLGKYSGAAPMAVSVMRSRLHGEAARAAWSAASAACCARASVPAAASEL